MANIDGITFTRMTTNFPSPETRFYLKIYWKSNNFDIEIIAENRKWFGTFSESDVKSYSEELNQTEADYFHKTKAILSKQFDNHSYELNHGVFSWSRLLGLNSNSKIIQGKIELTLSDDNYSIYDFIDSILDMNEAISAKNDVQKTTIEHLQKEVDNSLKDNLELVELKDNMESTLYSNFVQILNSKKRRIKFLEDTFLNGGSEEVTMESSGIIT